MIGQVRRVDLFMSEAIYTRAALLETIDRYEEHRKESEKKYSTDVTGPVRLALREMKSALKSLEERFPEIKEK